MDGMRKLKPANSNRGSKKGTTLKQSAKQRQGGAGTEEGILGYFDSVDKGKRQEQKEAKQRRGEKSMEYANDDGAGLVDDCAKLVGKVEEDASVGEQEMKIDTLNCLNEPENMPPLSQDVLMDAGQVVWRNSPVQDPVRERLEENEGGGHPTNGGGSGQSIESGGVTVEKALNKKKFLESRPVIEHTMPSGSLSDDLGNIEDVLQSMPGLVPSTRRRGARLSIDAQQFNRSHHRLSVERSNVVDSMSSVTTSFVGQSDDAGRVRGVGVTPQMKRSRPYTNERDGLKQKKSTSLALMKCCDALQSKLDNLGEKRTKKTTPPLAGQKAQGKDTSNVDTRDVLSGKEDVLDEIIEKAMAGGEPSSHMEHRVDMNAVRSMPDPQKLTSDSFEIVEKDGDWGDDDDDLLGALDAMEAAMIKERSDEPQATDIIAREGQSECFKRSIIHHTVVTMSRTCTPDGFPEVILKVKNGCSKVCIIMLQIGIKGRIGFNMPLK